MILRSMRAATLLGTLACQGDPPPVSPPARPPGPERASSPADSMVLEAAGATVWHTLSREATSGAGDHCLERTLEIRREGSSPIRVPLLYTLDIPTVVDDSTLEARVYGNCAPGDRYRIDMRTGQPTPIR